MTPSAPSSVDHLLKKGWLAASSFHIDHTLIILQHSRGRPRSKIQKVGTDRLRPQAIGSKGSTVRLNRVFVPQCRMSVHASMLLQRLATCMHKSANVASASACVPDLLFAPAIYRPCCRSLWPCWALPETASLTRPLANPVESVSSTGRETTA